MNLKGRYIVVGVAAAIVLAIFIWTFLISSSCSTGIGGVTWELEVWPGNQTDLDTGETRMEIEVVLSGQTSGTTIRDVVVVFENQSGSSFRTIPVGTIFGYTERNLTVELNQEPARIRLDVGQIENENNDPEYWIIGHEKRNGQYEQYVQRHHQPC
ncbi:hypothetical protein [Halorhabdus sp. CUG00001]|uniref:hypothetical protein n=1 Tax=Halorhabdus sp. CUG00001 TaxID=2600297 RepID=UPI00131D91B1|nr:hypothetical protein [Halorhabdus sp. CUG00001]